MSKQTRPKETPAPSRQEPTPLARQIPMVGLIQSGLADWRSVSNKSEDEQSPEQEEQRGE